MDTPAISSHSYVAGLQCLRRLWLETHEPAPRSDAAPIRVFVRDETRRVVGIARDLFPGGVDVALAGRGLAAQERAQELLADESAPALFDAPFEFDRLRVRVDVLERLSTGGFRLCAIRGSATVKQAHLDQLVVQLHVLRGLGIDIRASELIHVNESYSRRDGPIDAVAFTVRRDVTEDAEFLLSDVAKKLPNMLAAAAGAEPAIAASPHCRRPTPCPFFARCSADRTADWIYWLPSMRPAQYHALRETGVETISGLPPEAATNARQRRAISAHREGHPSGIEVAPELASLLRGGGPPAYYLDFETYNPIVPVLVDTLPFQPIPFQWSLHRIDAASQLTHRDFLADAATGEDPSRRFAEALIEALSGGAEPILVYSGYEASVLRALAARFGELASELRAIVARLFDLLPVVRAGVYARDFGGSFSIKSVAPALEPGFGYSDLEEVADGGAAAVALGRMFAGDVDDAERARLREALLAYCARDTQALVAVHRALCRLARASD